MKETKRIKYCTIDQFYSDGFPFLIGSRYLIGSRCLAPSDLSKQIDTNVPNLENHNLYIVLDGVIISIIKTPFK